MEMNLLQKLTAIQNELVARISAITDRPDGWLPHLVFVEEESEDRNRAGTPAYKEYRLVDFKLDGHCTLRSPITNEDDNQRHLSEINIDWLVTVWNYYCELSGIKDKQEPELVVFLFPIDMPRNISDEELIVLWNDNDDNVKVCTPDEFAEKINDESFNDTKYWIRFIKM